MSVSRKLIDKLNQHTNAFFWENPPDTPTFQEVLDRYANYSANLEINKREDLSKFFWDQIKEIKTPIIEDFSDEEVKVYFIFPRDKYDYKTNKLYLSGDFHGFTSTDNKRQEMEMKPHTDIMYRIDIMPRNSIVTYDFLQVPPEHQNKSRKQLTGEALPKSFYLEEITEVGIDPLTGYGLLIMSEKDFNEALKKRGLAILVKMDNGDFKLWGNKSGQGDWQETALNNFVLPEKWKNQESVFVSPSDNIFNKLSIGHTLKIFDEYAKHSDIGHSILCANVDNDLSGIDLFKDTDWKKLLTEAYPNHLKNLTHKGTYLCDMDNHLRKDEDAADMSKIWNNTEDTRSVSVFQSGEGKVDNLIIIHDGVGYMGTGAIERLDALIEQRKIPKNTAIICITQLPGLIEKYKKESPKEFEKATDPRPIEYASRIDDYVKFIDQALFQLGYDNVPATNRTLIGASMSGTASIYMVLQHEDKFGRAIVQAPTEGTRIILRPLMLERIEKKKLKKEEDLSSKIHLSCGKFETLKYAQNIRLAHTKEVAEILGSNDQPLPVDDTGNYGHLPHCWSQELTKILPGLYPHLQSKKAPAFSSKSIFSQTERQKATDVQHNKKSQGKKIVKDDTELQSAKEKNKTQKFTSTTENKRAPSTDDFNVKYRKGTK